MKSNVSLVGLGVADTYQLCFMRSSLAAPAFPGNTMYPILGMFLLNQTTAELIPAENLPVTVQPGFLLQGEHNAFGNTSVTHCKVSGDVVPKEVNTVLGAALMPLVGSRGTGFVLNNDPDLTKIRRYSTFSSTYSTFATMYFGRNLDDIYYDPSDWHGSTTVVKSSDGYDIMIISENHYWSKVLEITCTGDLYYLGKAGLKGRPNLQKGRCVSTITDKLHNTKTVSYFTNTTLELFCVTKPCNTSSISTDLVLTSFGETGDTGIISDLRSLLNLDKGNAPWLACYQAVESFKHIPFEGMEFARDMFNIEQLKLPLKRFTSMAKPKAWAQVFLWMHYGVIPTISSAYDLIVAIKKDSNDALMQVAKKFATRQTRYGTEYDDTQEVRDTKVTYKCNAKCTLRLRLQPQNMVEALVAICKSYNLVPSAANIWELLPYTFVVDWFANTSDAAKYVDYSSYFTTYEVDEIQTSHKWTLSLPANLYYRGAYGFVTLTAYTREIHYNFPAKPFDLAFTDPKGHWLEGIALLVAKTF